MNKVFLSAAAALAIACPLGAPLAAQDLAITNATLATGDGSDPVTGATVVIRGGQVVAAGPNVTVPAGVTAIDGTGKWVTPGLFAAVPYCVDLIGGPYLETHEAVCKAFRPKGAIRPAHP